MGAVDSVGTKSIVELWLSLSDLHLFADVSRILWPQTTDENLVEALMLMLAPKIRTKDS